MSKYKPQMKICAQDCHMNSLNICNM